MIWKNYGLRRIKYKDDKNFTTAFGIKLRRAIHPLVHFVICHVVDRPYEIVGYPTLEKGKPYIFAAGHSFPGEAASNLASIDRNAWILAGTTDQIDHNPEFYVAWINGLFFVNKFDKSNRGAALKKMKRILDNGSSVLFFPEGGLNHSETEYCIPLYPGVYYLAKETDCKVVPIVSEGYHDPGKIKVKAGEPLDFSGLNKVEAMNLLRDELSTLRFDLCEGEITERKSLKGDLHLEHMKHRLDSYLETKWIEPNWDEEMMYYRNSSYVSYEEAFGAIENVEITAENAFIIAPILARLEEYKRYDLKKYIKDNWKDRQAELRQKRGR